MEAEAETVKTRCPKAIYGQRYPCPAFVLFVVNFDVSRAAAPKGTEGDCILFGGH